MLDLLYIHWNVDPVLFHIGPLSIRWYSLLFVSGFIFGYYIFRSFYRHEGVNEAYLDPLLYAMLICVVIGARVLFRECTGLLGGVPAVEGRIGQSRRSHRHLDRPGVVC